MQKNYPFQPRGATGATPTVQTATPIISLTTGNTGALVADFYIFGDIVD